MGIVCLLATQNFFGQTITVLDKISQEPIEGVFVYDESHSPSRAETTDIKGQMNLEKFKKSKQLFLRHQSYELKVIDLGSSLRLNLIFLEPTWHSIPPIEVKAPRRQNSEAHNIGNSIQRINAITARLENPQTSADMIAQSGQVLIQKSQMGGGSPIIRGFEANRILLVVDGVRMNNAIYRSGHLQNAITIDPHYLSSTEIIFGPSSVLYGSDALGGVIHFHTKKPKFSLKKDEQEVGVNAFLRSSTANSERTGHLDFNLAGQRIAYNLSFSASSFGDLKMGRRRSHGYEDWGIVSSFVDPENDEVVQNTKQNLQPRTGYDQIDLGSKLFIQLKDSATLLFNLQFSTSSDINRWDRLNDFSDGIPRWAEWYYGPQERLFTAISLNLKKSKYFDDAVITAAYQQVEESRNTRRLNSEFRTNRVEKVDIFSLNADFSKRFKKRSTVYYGLELIRNDVASEASENHISSSLSLPASTRYPDGGSAVQSAAIYSSLSTSHSKTLKSNIGVRFSYNTLETLFENNDFFLLPFEEIDFDNQAITGTIGIEKLLKEQTQLKLNVSSGFKSPNVDDAGKVFEKDGFIVVPNEEVKPEYVVNTEIGINHFWNKRQSSFSIAAYYTRIFDALVRRDFQLNGADSLMFEGELARIQTNVNIDQAEIFGISLGLNWEINDWFRWSSTFNWTEGRDRDDQTPLAHIPPVFGKSELIFYNESLTGALYAYYNGWKRTEDFSPGTTDNPSEATIDGFPSWYTLNARVSRRFSPSFSFNFAIENILDQHYKTFASGLSASGRNLIFSATFNL
ncbi:MAG: TonB-dependent receptor [Bacteroidota bacterium]